MGQFVGCIKGIGEACLALDTPIVSGNVSLYNETNGEAILPTPTIGMVGLLPRLDAMIGVAPNAGDALILLGETKGWLGQSAYLWELFGRAEGDAPPVDLQAERRAGELVQALAANGRITAAHDLSDGGFAVAAAEMALAADAGVVVQGGDAGWFFGEDQARYLIACAPEATDAIIADAAAAHVPAARVGAFSGTSVVLGDASIPLSDLRAGFEGAFPGFMER
jgi:phosphoribosylformylglycinamidine synthase